MRNQYVFNRGDGQDVYFDDAASALPGATIDSISTTVQQRTAGTLAKNWAGGGELLVDGSTQGGEDAIGAAPTSPCAPSCSSAPAPRRPPART